MINIKLGDKSYQVPFFRGRVLFELDLVEPAYDKAQRNERLTKEEYAPAVTWFCHLFDDQFTEAEVLEKYPADDLLPDIFTAYIALLNSASSRLTEFPIPPAPMETTTETAAK